MGMLGERSNEDEGGGLVGRGRTVRLDEQRCATCNRQLHPWETVCPDDGGRAVRPEEVTAAPDPLLARLLAEEPLDSEDADPAP